MFDFDPRWQEPERPDPSRGSRGGSEPDPREREPVEPRDVFRDHVNLPRGLERERVDVRDRSYELRGSEARNLAIVGSFRVVPASDLRDQFDKPLDPRHGELWHLRESGLVRTVPLEGKGTAVVVLTKEGRELLDARRVDDGRDRQAFHDGLVKPREVTHDSLVYRAYERAAERIRERGGHIRRVVLDYELKRDYQRFRQREKRDRQGDERSERENEEIRRWALEHELPYEDGHVQFPDVRVEYELPDARTRYEDVEVLTPHYRGAHAAAKSNAGFTCYRGGGARIVGLRCRASSGGGGRCGGLGTNPRLAEEMLR